MVKTVVILFIFLLISIYIFLSNANNQNTIMISPKASLQEPPIIKVTPTATITPLSFTELKKVILDTEINSKSSLEKINNEINLNFKEATEDGKSL